MRLCYGGSFNPIHNGHLAVAKAVARSQGYAKVVLIPSGQPPHKPNDDPSMASAVDRLRMCQLAVEHDSVFSVSDIEITRAGPSFSIETIRRLRADGWHQVHWLIGADMLMALPNWREPEALPREARFIVVARPGWSFDWNALPPPFRVLQQNVVEAPLVPISASEIRQKITAGEPIDDWVPPAVVDYIKSKKLYSRGR